MREDYYAIGSIENIYPDAMRVIRSVQCIAVSGYRIHECIKLGQAEFNRKDLHELLRIRPREVLFVIAGTEAATVGKEGTVLFQDAMDTANTETWDLDTSSLHLWAMHNVAFHTVNLTAEEKRNGAPIARVVLANRILSSPWTEDDGPVVSAKSISIDFTLLILPDQVSFTLK